MLLFCLSRQALASVTVVVKKQVTGDLSGYSGKTFTIAIECNNTTDASVWEKGETKAIGFSFHGDASCTISETPPANPLGHSYDPPQYSSNNAPLSQPFTVDDGASIAITVTNNLKKNPATVASIPVNSAWMLWMAVLGMAVLAYRQYRRR